MRIPYGQPTAVIAVSLACMPSEKFLRLKRTIMKQESNNSKVYLDQEELNTLVKEVKETVAADINIKKENVNKNIFSAAELWNIQRMKKKTQRRSTLWN